MRLRLLTGIFSLLTIVNVHAFEPTVNAKAAYLFHAQSGKTLFESNAQQLHGPASLTKLMTLALLFETIQSEKLSLTSELPISEKAWRKGGSKMFLEVGKTVKVEDLIRGIIIASGNDACVVVAEYLGGTEDGFASQMNARAQEIGMSNSNFTNASGWPDPKQYTTAEDMVKLAAHIQTQYPEFYPYFSEQSFTYSNIRQSNRNGLLRQNVGVDGMKTGHTEKSGYHLLASGKEGDSRLISIVLGADGFAAREGENLKLLRYGFTQFETITLWKPNADVIEIPVWLGKVAKVTAIAQNGASTFAKKSAKKPSVVAVTYNSPIAAPILQGQEIGQLTTTFAGETFTTPLVAANAVAKASAVEKLLQKLFYRLGLE